MASAGEQYRGIAQDLIASDGPYITEIEETSPVFSAWDRFVDTLRKLEVNANDIEQFNKEFYVAFIAAQALNEGKKLNDLDLQFLPNELRYHNWKHTPLVVEKVLQILPGYLEEMKSSSPDGLNMRELLPKVKGLVFASIYHEIGYLKRIEGDEVYLAQGELYFDHVIRGMTYAPQIMEVVMEKVDGTMESVGGNDFISRMIKATDFNAKQGENETWGLVGIDSEFGNILKFADFLASFAHRDNIPGIVSDLYWENQNAVVINGFRQKWARKPDGKLDLEKLTEESGKIIFKPKLIDAQPDDQDYAIIQEVKFGMPISNEDNAYQITPMTLYNFVASEFLIKFQGALEEYLKYIDYIYDAGSGGNEVRNNYQINIDRIKLLHNAIEIPETDPFSIFEGAFTGHDLLQWTQVLKREGMLESEYKKDWLAVDRRVLGFGKDHNSALSRLVTQEIRDILFKIDRLSRSKALGLLFGQFREKMRGENVGDVFLNIAPGAYLQDQDGPFKTFEEANIAFDTSFVIQKENEGLPKLHYVITIRRDQDFNVNGQPDAVKMKNFATNISQYYKRGQISGISFLGFENRRLSDYQPFFDALEDKSIPLVILSGQTFPESVGTLSSTPSKFDKKLFVENIGSIATLADRFTNLVLWGLQDLQYLGNEEIDWVNNTLADKNLGYITTLTFDQMSGLISGPESHPIHKLNLPKLRKYFATGNPAYAGFSSVALDALRLHASQRTENEVINSISDNSFYPDKKQK